MLNSLSHETALQRAANIRKTTLLRDARAEYEAYGVIRADTTARLYQLGVDAMHLQECWLREGER